MNRGAPAKQPAFSTLVDLFDGDEARARAFVLDHSDDGLDEADYVSLVAEAVTDEDLGALIRYGRGSGPDAAPRWAIEAAKNGLGFYGLEESRAAAAMFIAANRAAQ